MTSWPGGDRPVDARDGRDGGPHVLHAVFGPPEPVMVITTSRRVDRSDEQLLFDRLDEALAAVCSPHGRTRFGCRQLAQTVVLDLRNTVLFSSTTLRTLSRRRDSRGERLRLVLDAGSAIAGQVLVLGLADAFEMYDDLPTAVLDPGR